jgi:hypothetical protein
MAPKTASMRETFKEDKKTNGRDSKREEVSNKRGVRTVIFGELLQIGRDDVPDVVGLSVGDAKCDLHSTLVG